MNDDAIVSVEQEVATIRMKRPHVVVLGAGASRATCPNGDKNGKVLPLMNDLARVVGVESLIKEWGISPTQNFEIIFSDLFKKRENDKIKQIENVVEEYLGQLKLPETPTIYDYLILSLRKNDLIATFNWDPLLMQAYLRSGQAGLGLPRLSFLHGNICVGYCEKDRVAGLTGKTCSKCGKHLKRVPLLYPINKKDYAKDTFIANEWMTLTRYLQNAFMITIFGYSGPRTDEEAINAMREAWNSRGQREIEQTAFITIQSDNEISENWDSFIFEHHYELNKDFYNSWIANHPRRTGEAFRSQYIDAKFIRNNPIPIDKDLPALWEWYGQFAQAENKDLD